MNNESITQAKARLNQAQQDLETLEAAESEAPTQPSAYSSTVSSCEVDPETGNIQISLTLYPGDYPVTPPPAPGENADSEPEDVPAQESVQELPPGQVPAQ